MNFLVAYLTDITRTSDPGLALLIVSIQLRGGRGGISGLT